MTSGTESKEIQLYRCQCGGVPRAQLMGTLVCDRCGNYRASSTAWPEPTAVTSKPKLAISERLLKHAHAPVFRSTMFPVLAELKQDLIDAAGELERQKREVEHLTQMLGRDADETSALTNIQVMCPVCQNALWVCHCPEKTSDG